MGEAARLVERFCVTDPKTLACGHPQAETTEPDGSVWCLICAMFVEPQAIELPPVVTALLKDGPVARVEFEAPNFDLDAISARFQERLRPALETALGAAMPMVEFELKTTAEMQEIVRVENKRLLSGVGVSGDELEDKSTSMAETCAPGIMGKLDPSGEARVFVVPQAYDYVVDAGEGDWDRIKSQSFLDVMLLHESVHAYQHSEIRNLLEFVCEATTQEEVVCRMAVVEGHAQYVTRKAAGLLGIEAELDLLTRTQTSVPEGVKIFGISKTLVEAAIKQLAFPYVEGEAFVGHVLGELGEADGLARIFASPPSRIHEVKNPPEYLDPKEWPELLPPSPVPGEQLIFVHQGNRIPMWVTSASSEDGVSGWGLLDPASELGKPRRLCDDAHLAIPTPWVPVQNARPGEEEGEWSLCPLPFGNMATPLPKIST